MKSSEKTAPPRSREKPHSLPTGAEIAGHKIGDNTFLVVAGVPCLFKKQVSENRPGSAFSYHRFMVL